MMGERDYGGDGWNFSLVPVVALLALIFALFFVVHTQSAYHHAKLEHVFDLAKEYRTTLRQTDTQFSDRWNEYENDAIDPYNGGNLDEQSYADLVNRFLAMDANRDSYHALAGFYDSWANACRSDCAISGSRARCSATIS